MNIGIDVDSTLADTMITYMIVVNKLYGTNYNKQSITTFNIEHCIPELRKKRDLAMELFKIVWQTYWREIPATEEFILSKLTRLQAGGHKIIIVTNQQLLTAIPVQKWLIMKEIPYDAIIVSGNLSKHIYPIDLLLDDNPDNVRAMLKAKKAALLYPQPWNKQDQMEIPSSTIADLEDSIECLKENYYSGF